MLVQENFTGVRAEWWWERRLGGGIAVCQELDPKVMAREISERIGRKHQEVERVVEEELGLEDLEPVVLTFEMRGDTAADAARMLAERSAMPEGSRPTFTARSKSRPRWLALGLLGSANRLSSGWRQA